MENWGLIKRLPVAIACVWLLSNGNLESAQSYGGVVYYRGRIAGSSVRVESQSPRRIYAVGTTYQPRSLYRTASYTSYSAPRYPRETPEENFTPSRFVPKQPTVPGTRAVLRNGVAYAPEAAPENIKRAIWAVNTLRKKPYRWGGGHGSFYDSGYDCSGTVSFALYHAGLLRSPMTSKGFTRWGHRGNGRWITVYSRSGHTYAVIAGLRLDTTGFSERDGPRWRARPRSTRGFQARHYAGV